MLVKIGHVWCAPEKVSAIIPRPHTSETMIIVDQKEFYIPGAENCDTYAEIINNHSQQTFGGDDEKK